MTAPRSASHVQAFATAENGKHTDALPRQYASAVLITCFPRKHYGGLLVSSHLKQVSPPGTRSFSPETAAIPPEHTQRGPAPAIPPKQNEQEARTGQDDGGHHRRELARQRQAQHAAHRARQAQLGELAHKLRAAWRLLSSPRLLTNWLVGAMSCSLGSMFREDSHVACTPGARERHLRYEFPCSRKGLMHALLAAPMACRRHGAMLER